MTRVEVASIAAVAVAVVATPAAAWAARRLGVVDNPGPLKPQAKPVPYLGGVGVFAGLLVGVSLARPLLVLPLILAVALGTADDFLDVNPLIRLGGQVFIGIVAGLVVSTRFPTFLSVVLVTIVTVLLMNGINLIDGLDSLAGGVCCVAAAAFAIMLRGEGREFAAAVAFSVVGFLVYNRPPARVYLGDGGAYLLGAALALLMAYAWGHDVSTGIGLSGALVVAVPATEVVLAIARRIRSGTSLTAGDRGHPYDRLVDRGWTKLAAAGTYVAVELVLAALAIAVYRMRTVVGPALSVAAVSVIVAVLAAATVVSTLHKKTMES